MLGPGPLAHPSDHVLGPVRALVAVVADRARRPALGAVGAPTQGALPRVAPRVRAPVRSAPRLLPLLRGRQAPGEPVPLAAPGAVGHGVAPGHARHGVAAVVVGVEVTVGALVPHLGIASVPDGAMHVAGVHQRVEEVRVRVEGHRRARDREPVHHDASARRRAELEVAGAEPRRTGRYVHAAVGQRAADRQAHRHLGGLLAADRHRHPGGHVALGPQLEQVRAHRQRVERHGGLSAVAPVGGREAMALAGVAPQRDGGLGLGLDAQRPVADQGAAQRRARVVLRGEAAIEGHRRLVAGALRLEEAVPEQVAQALVGFTMVRHLAEDLVQQRHRVLERVLEIGFELGQLGLTDPLALDLLRRVVSQAQRGGLGDLARQAPPAARQVTEVLSGPVGFAQRASGAAHPTHDRPSTEHRRLDLVAHLGGPREAVLRVARQAPHHHRLEVGRDLRVRRHVAGQLRVAGPHLPQDGLRGVADERRAAGEDLVEDGAERVDVGALRERVDEAHRLLGAHVARGAGDVADAGPEDRLVRASPHDRSIDARAHDLREAPVHHEDLAELAEHDVGGLEVAVDDAAAVGVRHGHAHLHEEVEHARPAEPPHRIGVALREARQDVLQRPPLDELHREERPLLLRIDPDLVHRDDARVLELGGDPGLVEEAGGGVRHRTFRAQLLERDQPLQ